MIEIARLVAAGLAVFFFLWGAFTKVREDLDNIVADMKRAGLRNAIGAFFAAGVFACEVAMYFWPQV